MKIFWGFCFFNRVVLLVSLNLFFALLILFHYLCLFIIGQQWEIWFYLFVFAVLQDWVLKNLQSHRVNLLKDSILALCSFVQLLNHLSLRLFMFGIEGEDICWRLWLRRKVQTLRPSNWRKHTFPGCCKTLVGHGSIWTVGHPDPLHVIFLHVLDCSLLYLFGYTLWSEFWDFVLGVFISFNSRFNNFECAFLYIVR